MKEVLFSEKRKLLAFFCFLFICADNIFHIMQYSVSAAFFGKYPV